MLEARAIRCPYCGEPIEITLDLSAGTQSYVEDCVVCCRPIEVRVEVGEDGSLAGVWGRREDE